jgi:predicted homoserine dehydrogenase-like protein
MPTNVALTGLARDLEARAATCGRSASALSARAAGALPVGLLTWAKVTAPIPKGALITRANTALPDGSRLVALRARQDAMLEAAG